jgi:hypothetical protein
MYGVDYSPLPLLNTCLDGHSEHIVQIEQKLMEHRRSVESTSRVQTHTSVATVEIIAGYRKQTYASPSGTTINQVDSTTMHQIVPDTQHNRQMIRRTFVAYFDYY